MKLENKVSKCHAKYEKMNNNNIDKRIASYDEKNELNNRTYLNL